MNKKRGITTLIVAMAMFCMMSMSAFAAFDKHITLPKDQAWTSSYSITRSGDYSHVWACCDSVYPTAGTDNFTKIQARLVNYSGTLIMDKEYEVLKEGETYKKLTIKEGYLSENPVYIQFRGNSSSAAEAIVNYYSN